jgi:hypothetical protein
MNHRFSLLIALGVICVTAAAIRANAASAQPRPRKFEHAELFAGTSSGQKKAGRSTKGSLVFNSESKSVEFQREKGGEPVVSIPYAQIKSLLYEQTSKPRYTEAVLISPMFLLAHSKKHYLTIQYSDSSGTGQYAIVHLDKKNAQEAIAAVTAETGKEVERAEEK